MWSCAILCHVTLVACENVLKHDTDTGLAWTSDLQCTDLGLNKGNVTYYSIDIYNFFIFLFSFPIQRRHLVAAVTQIIMLLVPLPATTNTDRNLTVVSYKVTTDVSGYTRQSTIKEISGNNAWKQWILIWSEA